MKCYYDHWHGCFLDYFHDPILDDEVIYAGDIPFQYKKVEGRYTQFIGNSAGTGFTVGKKNHEFLLSQSKNNANMSSDSLNFGPLNTNQNCSNFVHVGFTDRGDLSYHAIKQDADAEYLEEVTQAICSHVGSIHFMDPANIRQVHGTIMNEVRNEAMPISDKYKL